MKKVFKYIITIIFVAAALTPGTVFSNGKSKTAGVFINGKIEPKVDFFGRRFFTGEIINKFDERVDYVYIEFRLFDDKKQLLEKVRSYVYGAVHVFKDSTVSTSSIEPGKTAKFSCHTSIKDESIKSYNYNIGYKEFEELPEKY